MKQSILAVAVGVFVALSGSVADAATPTHIWSQGFGDTSGDFGGAVAVDDSGNVLVTGAFQGTINFGGGNLASIGNGAIFLAKYNADGVHQWSRCFGGPSHDGGNAVAVDGSGNVFVTGYFQLEVELGGGRGTGFGMRDVFLAKYDASGHHLWSRRFGSTGFDQGHGVAVDALGNVVVTGEFQGTVNFGGGNLVSAGGAAIFLAKYDANGAHLWSRGFGNTDANYGYAVAVDDSGNAFVTGRFSDTVNFGGGSVVSVGLTDVFLAKFDRDGNHVWSRHFGSTGFDTGLAVAVDSLGNVLATGGFRGTVDFGGGNLVSAGDTDVFLAKYNPNGVHLWSHQFGSSAPDYGHAVAADALGNVLVTGAFEGTADFGGSNLVCGGMGDVFIAKYTADGSHVWSQRFGGPANDYPTALALDARENVLVTGCFSEAVDFGGGALVGAGYTDIFVAKYAGGTATDVSEAPPRNMLSMSASPNPFNPRLTVSYRIPVPGNVTMAIYDVRGKRIRTLVDNEERAVGEYWTDWDGLSEAGLEVPSGVYLARIEQNGATRSKKVALLK